MKFQGKTLLVLGSNVGSTDIVRYARENGAKVIVTDYYPPERSAAKKLADEILDISTGDIEKLCEVIEDYSVDGVLAGISEFNLLNAMELSKRYNLPFYCTKEQWDLVEHKNNFRRLCVENGVPCPKTYYTGGKLRQEDWDRIQLPAVIKPVDASTSAGVHICYTKEELKNYEEDSLAKSSNGQIIIEECVFGDEFTAHYTIVGGKAALSSIDNRYPIAIHSGTVTTIPIARIYPSTYIDEFLKQVDPAMVKLCSSLNIQDAILFIQGFYNRKNNTFKVFEAGLRSAGEAPYRFVDKINGLNAMHLLVDHVLSTSTEYDLSKEDPYLKGKACGVVSYASRGGRVGSINGLESAVVNTPSVREYESRYPVGSVTPNGDTLRQLMIRFIMIADNTETLRKDIRYLNGHITVLDDKGEDMVIKMDPSEIKDYR